MKNPILLITATLALAIGAAFAQDDLNPEVSEEGSRTVRFYCMAETMPQYFYDVKKNEPIEIGSAVDALSRPHPMPRDRVLEIYRKVLPPPNAPAGTEPLKQVLASAKIPAGFSRAIVLLFPADDKLRVVAYGDSYQIHPRGSVRVFNFSPLEISLRVGDVTNRFMPTHEGIMPWVGKANVVVFQINAHIDDKWKVMGISERATRPNLRTFMFAFPGLQKIGTKFCYDLVPDET